MNNRSLVGVFGCIKAMFVDEENDDKRGRFGRSSIGILLQFVCHENYMCKSSTKDTLKICLQTFVTQDEDVGGKLLFFRNRLSLEGIFSTCVPMLSPLSLLFMLATSCLVLSREAVVRKVFLAITSVMRC